MDMKEKSRILDILGELNRELNKIEKYDVEIFTKLDGLS